MCALVGFCVKATKHEHKKFEWSAKIAKTEKKIIIIVENKIEKKKNNGENAIENTADSKTTKQTAHSCSLHKQFLVGQRGKKLFGTIP